MALDAFRDDMGHWTDTVVNHLHGVSPVFACEAQTELGNIDRKFPNILRTPLTRFGAHPPAVPVLYIPCTPTSRAPHGPASIFPTTHQNLRPAWTSLRSGAPIPNGGVRGNPDLPVFSRPSSPSNGGRISGGCGCGGAGAGGCHCATPRHQNSLFPSPFRPFPQASSFSRRIPAPPLVIPPVIPSEPSPDHIPAWALPGQIPQSPFRAMPTLPQEPPSVQQWDFPAGSLSWLPHPAPHPSVPAAHFWPADNVLRGIPVARRNFPNTPLNAQQAARLTGGWPLPGAAPWWTPSVWPQPVDGTAQAVQLAPCLIPNPADSENPQVIWDLSQTPYIAEWVAGYNTASLQSQFNQKATIPAVDEIHIALPDGIVRRLWGHITVRNPGQGVLVWDILYAIYDYFQKPITQEELSFLQSLDPSNHATLLDALHRRCAGTHSLPEFESSRGPRRVDALGDRRKFWGLWIRNNGDDNWHLNLGLKA